MIVPQEAAGAGAFARLYLARWVAYDQSLVYLTELMEGREADSAEQAGTVKGLLAALSSWVLFLALGGGLASLGVFAGTNLSDIAPEEVTGAALINSVDPSLNKDGDLDLEIVLLVQGEDQAFSIYTVVDGDLHPVASVLTGTALAREEEVPIHVEGVDEDSQGVLYVVPGQALISPTISDIDNLAIQKVEWMPRKPIKICGGQCPEGK